MYAAPMQGWFVARTHYQRERWACENILRQLATPYTPKFAERIKVGAHYEVKPRLLFPSYVFVKTYDGRWRFLLGTYGVMSVLMTGNEPALVLDRDIKALREREDGDGLISLPALDKKPDKPRLGATVRLDGGMYSGYTGIYDGCDHKERERVLLDYLGRKTPVLLCAGSKVSVIQ